MEDSINMYLMIFYTYLYNIYKSDLNQGRIFRLIRSLKRKFLIKVNKKSLSNFLVFFFFVLFFSSFSLIWDDKF